MAQIEYGRSGTPIMKHIIRPIKNIEELDPRKITETVAPAHLTMIEFYTPGCEACRTFTTTLTEAAEKLNGKVKMYRVNDPDLDYSRRRFGIPGHPTTVFFYEGRIIGSIVGAMPYADAVHSFETNLKRILLAHMAPDSPSGATVEQLLSIIPDVA